MKNIEKIKFIVIQELKKIILLFFFFFNFCLRFFVKFRSNIFQKSIVFVLRAQTWFSYGISIKTYFLRNVVIIWVNLDTNNKVLNLINFEIENKSKIKFEILTHCKNKNIEFGGVWCLFFRNYILYQYHTKFHLYTYLMY